MSVERVGRRRRDPDSHRGALEGNTPGESQQWNHNAPALDDSGMPSDAVAIAQDVIGANEDETEG